MSRRVYTDACIAIYFVERRNPWYDRVVAALAEDEPPTICLSALVSLECLVGALRSGDDGLVAAYREFFGMQEWLPMSDAVIELATDLRARYNLKTPDAIHLGAAIHHRCDEF